MGKRNSQLRNDADALNGRRRRLLLYTIHNIKETERYMVGRAHESRTYGM
jgi:hypothetical protein